MQRSGVRLISPGYRAMQRAMHAAHTYGDSGGKWAPAVATIAYEHGCRTILDYGCGTGAMAARLRQMVPGLVVTEYDPGVMTKSEVPKTPAHLVTCIDVLEHIEPERLGRVIEHMHRLTWKRLFVVVSTRLAGKHLPDGRNAHLIIKPEKWWHAKLLEHGYYLERSWNRVADEFCAVLKPA